MSSEQDNVWVGLDKAQREALGPLAHAQYELRRAQERRSEAVVALATAEAGIKTANDEVQRLYAEVDAARRSMLEVFASTDEGAS